MNYVLLLIASLIILLKIPAHYSLSLGLILSLALNPTEAIRSKSKLWSTRILQFSVILMGASLNFSSLVKSSSEGIIITFFSITLVFLFSHLLNIFFKISSPLHELITSGTAICGGSAIAATGPVLGANSISMATSLGLVFTLNALAIFIFPPIGKYLHLTQEQFGVWSALAIHDTSSVVAATQIFGEEAAKIGPTLKLTRALWIIPLTFLFSLKNKSKTKVHFPWFILGFLFLSLVFTITPAITPFISYLSIISKTGLSITLFLIGLNLNKAQIKSIGPRPFFFGISLWVLTLVGSLLYVLNFI